ncbi:MAG: hypothetical protein ACRDGM_18565, partial [bacterium]
MSTAKITLAPGWRLEIPLEAWIPGEYAQRPERWARWQLSPPRGPSYQRHVGPYVVRANHDAGGYYAELATSAGPRTLAFVYPHPMAEWWMSMSRMDEYDWRNAERDQEAAIRTAIAAAHRLTARPEAAERYLLALTQAGPTDLRAGAMHEAEEARQHAKADARKERPKKSKGHRSRET